jgi:hypothetical protein
MTPGGVVERIISLVKIKAKTMLSDNRMSTDEGQDGSTF